VFRGFPLTDGHDSTPAKQTSSYAAVLASVFSLVSRPFIHYGPVPLFGCAACAPRSGKSKIAKAAVAAALGHLPTLTHFTDEVEFGKILMPLMLAADRAIVLDNVETSIHSAKLCSLITENTLIDRILGQSKFATLTNTSVIFATGNNLIIAGDLATRSVRVDIDPRMERPEERKFDFDPVQRALQLRPKLVTSALTALRAYVLAGMPWELGREPWGGFEAWDKLVCGCLHWLGYADPYATREQILGSDPIREANAELIEAWLKEFGDEDVSLSDIRNKARGEVYELLLSKGAWDSHHVKWLLQRLVGPGN
jgi:putative DNA primase/helicase